MVKDIVIVGGGGSGWMTAGMLVTENKYKITVIEPEGIPPIGVGEGTWPTMKSFLMEMDLDIDDIGGTKKLGIDYIDWYVNHSSKHNHFYHPFFNMTFTKKLDMNDIFIEYINGGLLEKKLLFEKLFPESYGETFITDSYGYHFDVDKFIPALKEKCINLGCKVINAKVEDCKFNLDGSIKSVVLDDEKEIVGDYFVDCTGFKRVLISKMKNTFIDLSDEFLCNSAITTHIDLKNEKEYYWTKCSALSSGWVWNIPLKDKIGIGYVYSDKFISDTDAKKELNEHLDIEGNYQLLQWKPGFLKEPFVKNCVAIGLSAGFIEPLEATNYQMQWIIIDRLKALLDGKIRNSNANTFVGRWFNSLAFFIISHYLFSKRNDSKFWKYFSSLKIPHDIKNIINNLFRTEDIVSFASIKNFTKKTLILPTGLSWFYLLISYGINFKKELYNK